MPKEVIAIDLQRPSTNIPWGFVICGGRDQVFWKVIKSTFVKSFITYFAQGPNTQSWQCEENDSCLQGRPLQNGLSDFSKYIQRIPEFVCFIFFVQVNGRPVFNLTHDECCREIKSSGQTLRIECERGDGNMKIQMWRRSDCRGLNWKWRILKWWQ